MGVRSRTLVHRIFNLSESNILNLFASQEKHKVAPGCQHLLYPAFSDTEIFGDEAVQLWNHCCLLWMEMLA